MELIFFRHGIAQERDPQHDDAERALTEVGRRRTLEAAQGLARVFNRPDAIVTSPKRRAFETAHLLREVFELPVSTQEALAEGSVMQVARWLAGRSEERLLLVGHEPGMSAMVEWLVMGRMVGNVELKKAGVAWLELPGPVVLHPHDGGQARLRALLPPRVLRALGR